MRYVTLIALNQFQIMSLKNVRKAYYNAIYTGILLVGTSSARVTDVLSNVVDKLVHSVDLLLTANQFCHHFHCNSISIWCGLFLKGES